ncbi:hypothetical protein ABIA14_004439 [Sinorhizobium fredii]
MPAFSCLRLANTVHFLVTSLGVGYFTKFCKINHIVHKQAVMPFRLLARVAQILPQIGYSGYAPQISGINVIRTHKCRTLEDGEG